MYASPSPEDQVPGLNHGYVEAGVVAVISQSQLAQLLQSDSELALRRLLPVGAARAATNRSVVRERSHSKQQIIGWILQKRS